MSNSWPPENRVTYGQIGVIATLIAAAVTAAVYVPNAIAEEGRRVEEAAKEMVAAERADARREFATREDVAAMRAQLMEAIRILREMQREQREMLRQRASGHRR